ncbi:MAG: type II toxin-antitoxin system VapC family toxin [Cyclobacteriaceae bacterium]|nr:type II toxin-antitoxin system VapC family toxin [Cyclobacteriaceae bacterium]
MVILGTNIIIELYKGNLKVREKCEGIGEENLYINAVVAAEFYSGVLNKRELTLVKKHLQNFPVIHINNHISEISLNLMERYCLSHHPYISDILIAPTALYYESPVYTLNKNDFQYIPGIKLV